MPSPAELLKGTTRSGSPHPPAAATCKVAFEPRARGEFSQLETEPVGSAREGQHVSPIHSVGLVPLQCLEPSAQQ